MPLINIAVVGTGIATPELSGSPYERATLYRESESVSVGFVAPASGEVFERISRPISATRGMTRSRKKSSFECYASETDAILAEASLEGKS